MSQSLRMEVIVEEDHVRLEHWFGGSGFAVHTGDDGQYYLYELNEGRLPDSLGEMYYTLGSALDAGLKLT